MTVTIFTPTYNRAYCLPQLYKSLCSQTTLDFEWIIVDDCSTDNTKNLIEEWVSEKKIDIKYFIQPVNGGKHRAINQGVTMAQGELFFIVDSDDFLTEDAVESIILEWQSLDNKHKYAGLCFRRMTKNFKILGDDFPTYRCSGTSIDIAYKWKCIADKAEVFKTSMLRTYPFPDIKSENFCQEAIIWFKIARDKNGLLLCINKGIYVCEYLPDGLSANLSEKMNSNTCYSLLWTLTLLSIPYEWRSLKQIYYHLKTLVYLVYKLVLKRLIKHDS